MASLIARLARRVDGWANAFTALGSATRDKTQGWYFGRTTAIPDETLEALYYGDDLANRAVSAIVNDALRRGFELEHADEADDVAEGKLWDALAALDVLGKFQQAATWGRLFGGGALWIGAIDGGSMAEPLNEKRIRSVDFVHVLDKREMTPATYYADPMRPEFGRVQTYRINLSSRTLGSAPVLEAVVHESRLVLFGGMDTSPREKARLQGWDYSVLQIAMEALVGANANWQSVRHLMEDASQAVYKVKGFVEMLGAGQEANIRSRMEMVELGRSVARAVILDAEGEEFERKATPFTQIPEIIDRTWQRLAAALRMPLTVLMGTSPAGLNATGESDSRNWYDQVEAYREQVLKPRLRRVVRLVAAGLKLDPLAWDVCFPSLWQPSDKELAETRKLVAEADKIYVDTKVLPAATVAEQRFGAAGYSTETVVNPADREAALATEEPAPEPDPIAVKQDAIATAELARAEAEAEKARAEADIYRDLAGDKP